MDESTPAAPPPLPKTPPLAPKDHAEAVAIFRSEIVGALTRKELDHGELRAAFRALSEERFRPPGVETTRRYSITTLERWYYAYRAGGLAALRPAPRSDRGHAQELSATVGRCLLDGVPWVEHEGQRLRCTASTPRPTLTAGGRRAGAARQMRRA